MAHIATKIDLSPANREFQVNLLGRAVREHLGWPGTRYLDYAVWRRDEAIAEGHLARFKAWHPVLSREIAAFEREHLTATTISPVIAPTSAPTTTTAGAPEPPIACDHAAVPEPPSWALLAVGFGLMIAGLWRKGQLEHRETGGRS